MCMNSEENIEYKANNIPDLSMFFLISDIVIL